MSNGITAGLRSAFCGVYETGRAMRFDEFLALCDDIDAKYEDLERKVENSTQLPVDCDGVPIKPGDKMASRTREGEVLLVDAVGVQCFFAWDNKRNSYGSYCAARWRHYKPDSWDLIIHDAVCGGDEDELVARCKALAGEAK